MIGHPDPICAEPKLFVGGLRFEATREEVYQHFQNYGPIKSCVLLQHKDTGKSKGCAMILYTKWAHAEAAVTTDNGQILHLSAPRQMIVKFADPQRRQEDGMLVGVTPKKLFVGQIPKGIGPEQIRSIFAPYGEIVDLNLMPPKKDGSMGCAFVTFGTWEATENAMEGVDGTFSFPGAANPIAVKLADAKPQDVQRVGMKRGVMDMMTGPANKRQFMGAGGMGGFKGMNAMAGMAGMGGMGYGMGMGMNPMMMGMGMPGMGGMGSGMMGSGMMGSGMMGSGMMGMMNPMAQGMGGMGGQGMGGQGGMGGNQGGSGMGSSGMGGSGMGGGQSGGMGSGQGWSGGMGGSGGMGDQTGQQGGQGMGGAGAGGMGGQDGNQTGMSGGMGGFSQGMQTGMGSGQGGMGGNMGQMQQGMGGASNMGFGGMGGMGNMGAMGGMGMGGMGGMGNMGMGGMGMGVMNAGPMGMGNAQGNLAAAKAWKLFIGQISFDLNEPDLYPFFQQFGTVLELALLRNNDGRHRGCGFLTFSSQAEADAAINAANGAVLPNDTRQRQIMVKYANQKS